jgi:hypothetical protein
MKHFVHRSTLIAAALATSASLLIVACGGGGSKSVPSPSAPTAAVTAPNLNQTVSTYTGPTGKMTVSIKIPQRPQTSAAVHAKLRALYGLKAQDKTVRMISNTSPTAAIRAVGLQQNRYAAQVQKQTGRAPEFISGFTDSMEIVISDQSFNVLLDQLATCSTSACTMDINAPVGTNLNVSMFLYESCGFLLSAGNAPGVTVTTAGPNSVTITNNPVVGYFDVETSASTPLQDDSESGQSFTVTTTALDFDMNMIASPGTPQLGVLMDSNFNPITEIEIDTDADNGVLNPLNSAALTIGNDFTISSANFTYTGLADGATSIDVNSPYQTGPNVMPNFLFKSGESGISLDDTHQGHVALSVTHPSLQWTNPNNYPQSATDPSYQFVNQNLLVSTYNVQFPTPTTGAQIFNFGLSEAFNDVTNIAITTSGCGSTVTAPPTISYAAASTAPFVQLTVNPSANLPSCVITATDDAASPRTAVMNLTINKPTITISNSARKH